jgi:hypothetical protein
MCHLKISKIWTSRYVNLNQIFETKQLEIKSNKFVDWVGFYNFGSNYFNIQSHFKFFILNFNI